MSGILGKLSFEPDETLARQVLDQMLDALSAGPQERRAIFTERGIALGISAAADLTIGTSENGDLHVAADAQITNAALLRGQLEALGHRFRGHSDSEVIAHAYEQWNVRGLARLRGRFACAIWSERERRLIVARDHFGTRPMYFAMLQNHGVVIASRISALLRDPGISRLACPQGIDAYLTLGYVPAPLTPYQRISKLEPAQALIVEGRRFHLEQYWEGPEPASLHREQAEAAFEACVGRVVRRQLKHTTPAALLYSGGTASAALLAASPRSLGPVVTIAIDQSERDLTRSDAAAARLGRTREIEKVAHRMTAFATESTAHAEEPLADPMAVVQLAICTGARRHADVALAGHGLSAAGEKLPASIRDQLWDGEHRRALYTRHFAWQVREGHPAAQESATFLPDNLLAAADAAATATGLAVRFPYLDVEFVEVAAAVRTATKRRGYNALRALLRRHLPADLLPPVRRVGSQHWWLRTLIPSMVPPVLLNRRFDERGIVSLTSLAKLWEEHRTGRRDHALRLWSLLVLEFWFRHYIDGDAAAEPLEYAVLKAA